MSRIKALILTLCLCLMVSPALAQSPSLISDEMITAETVNYNNTVTAEKGVYERSYSAQATDYYPYTYTVRFEGANARFVEYLVSRKQEVKAGDPLVTFTLDTDEVALASKRQAVQRAQENYAVQKLQKQEAIQEQLELLPTVQERFEREILTLTIQRAQVALEQYCSQQERQIATMEKEIAELEEESSQNTLFAPFDGMITDIQYKRFGERLYTNEALITICRTDTMLLRVNNDSLYFRYGMDVDVAVGPAKSRTILAGHVVGADNMLPESRRSGYAYIELEPYEESSSFRIGQPSVSGKTFYVENVFLLPRRAVVLDAGKHYVSKLSDGTVQKRYVNVAMQNSTHAWILQGLEEGETIIID